MRGIEVELFRDIEVIGGDGDIKVKFLDIEIRRYRG